MIRQRKYDILYYKLFASTITKRKTRNCIWIKAHSHTVDAIHSALKEVIFRFGERANQVFEAELDRIYAR